MDADIKVVKNQQGVDTFVFEPYNHLNRLITKEEIETILQKYGVMLPIFNYEIYKRAFIHKSYLKKPKIENETNNVIIVPKPDDCIPLFTKSNERLEFIGDGVLECVTKFYLYKRFPKEQEGFMTEKKIALVKNEAIGRISYEMGLHRWFIISKHAEEKQTRTNLKKLGCLFEAFIGAIFVDFNKVAIDDSRGLFDTMFISGPGFQVAEIFISNVFKEHVNWIELIQNNDNYKNILQMKIQKEFKITPEYLEIQPYHNDLGYHMGVFLCLGQQVYSLRPHQSIPIQRFSSFKEIHEMMSFHGKVFIMLGEGLHKIKKKAEQTACEMAVQYFASFRT